MPRPALGAPRSAVNTETARCLGTGTVKSEALRSSLARLSAPRAPNSCWRLIVRFLFSFKGNSKGFATMVSKRKLLKAETSGENSNADPPSRCSETKKSRISAPDRVETEGIFEELIRTSGIVLKVGEGQNEIAVDQMTFQKKLCLALEKHPAYPGVVKQFISGLESHIKDRNQFKNCLLPCSPIQTEGSRTRHLYCDSLIKLLLGIKILQPAVITLLLEKIPEFFFDIVGTFGTDFPRLIINQFKWLDKFLDSQVGTDSAITCRLFPVSFWNASQVR